MRRGDRDQVKSRRVGCPPVISVLVFVLLSAGWPLVAVGQDNPAADPQAIVSYDDVRFTVLTPQLIRLEWAADRQFEDRASLVFINRRLPVPAFQTAEQGDWLLLSTEKLTLRYKRKSGAFRADNLQVELEVSGRRVVWAPGAVDSGNLGGTIRTLDGVQGATALDAGLLSRDGWVLIDDSQRPLFDSSDWPWVVPRPPGQKQDWYFFGFGHDYKKALQEFTRVAGKIALPPRFAFGTWWSRYWAYSDQDLLELVQAFQEHDVPLDVLVIDMDWHQTFGVRWWENKKDQSGHTLGWTGYTWNRLYFPDPPPFLRWLHQQGLKTTLNMHPASGVQPHEEQYAEMARAMGLDPKSQKYVPFEITNKKFAEHYLNLLHHPLEQQGVDFFWLDWQQEHITGVPGLSPTWWLNYVHSTDLERRGKRPLILHRWGGLGNHRYQIGFSGDTISVWESLAFQPYFTATAANVAYGYWSHDIGGHMPGKVSPELYTRWLQFGVFSPILRTHTTKNPEAERRLWAYPAEYAQVAREAFLLRYALIPYIYTTARLAYDTGLSLCRPLYYDYPETPEAYEFKDEYMFGEQILVAPVTAPMSEDTQLATKTLWLPEGTWIEWSTGTQLTGPVRLERSFRLEEIPAYVKAGAVIPLQPKMRHSGEKPVDPLILTIFPGDSGEARIYDDEGHTLGYKKGQYTWTSVRHRRSGGEWRVEIFPVEGSYPGMLTQRGYEIRLPLSLPPESIHYGSELLGYSAEGAASGWHYDGNTLTTIISLPRAGVEEKVEVLITLSQPETFSPQRLSGVPGMLARLRAAMNILNTTWPKAWSPDTLIEAAQTGRRMTLNPGSAREEVEKLTGILPRVVEEIYQLEVSCEVVVRALAQLGERARCTPSKRPVAANEASSAEGPGPGRLSREPRRAEPSAQAAIRHAPF